MSGALALQMLILGVTIIASAALGFWLARQLEAKPTQTTDDMEKVAQTIEQLRARADQAEADKVRALIASERDRKRMEALASGYRHAAE
ncbi:MAG: hypothetical protein OXC60_07695 [Litoreibacter sp.]|nr:hypothetical protein [Litoreibacter sp.]